MSAGLVLKGVATPTAPPVGYVRLFVDEVTGDFYVQDSSGVVTVVGGIGPTGPAGADGADGNTVLNGAVAPTTEGVDGDFYIDTAANLIYGPKAAGVWPAGVSLVGPQGPTGLTGPAGADGADGADGVDGRTVLNGAVPPTTEGVDGDFYIDTATSTIYGPKAAGAWPAGVALVGPTGPAGADGRTVLSGAVAPTTEGVDGDFYINTATNEIYGPKTAGAWGSPTSLVGPAGADGVGGIAPADGLVIMQHGANASVARPAAGTVYWQGSVDPVNKALGDFWLETAVYD